MLFTSQRLLLTLLNALGGSVGYTDFQKLLFLYTRECEETASYQFVPHRFGGFSFTSYADKRRLVDAGLLEADDQHWRLSLHDFAPSGYNTDWILEWFGDPIRPSLYAELCGIKKAT